MSQPSHPMQPARRVPAITPNTARSTLTSTQRAPNNQHPRHSDCGRLLRMLVKVSHIRSHLNKHDYSFNAGKWQSGADNELSLSVERQCHGAERAQTNDDTLGRPPRGGGDGRSSQGKARPSPSPPVTLSHTPRSLVNCIDERYLASLSSAPTAASSREDSRADASTLATFVASVLPHGRSNARTRPDPFTMSSR